MEAGSSNRCGRYAQGRSYPPALVPPFYSIWLLLWRKAYAFEGFLMKECWYEPQRSLGRGEGGLKRVLLKRWRYGPIADDACDDILAGSCLDSSSPGTTCGPQSGRVCRGPAVEGKQTVV